MFFFILSIRCPPVLYRFVVDGIFTALSRSFPRSLSVWLSFSIVKSKEIEQRFLRSKIRLITHDILKTNSNIFGYSVNTVLHSGSHIYIEIYLFYIYKYEYIIPCVCYLCLTFVTLMDLFISIPGSISFQRTSHTPSLSLYKYALALWTTQFQTVWKEYVWNWFVNAIEKK